MTVRSVFVTTPSITRSIIMLASSFPAENATGQAMHKRRFSLSQESHKNQQSRQAQVTAQFDCLPRSGDAVDGQFIAFANLTNQCGSSEAARHPSKTIPAAGRWKAECVASTLVAKSLVWRPVPTPDAESRLLSLEIPVATHKIQ